MIEEISVSPNGFEITHYWCKVGDDIELVSEELMIQLGMSVHADVWGQEAWEQKIRGYFDEKTGVINCHNYEATPKKTVRKIIKRFEEQGLICLKFRGKID